MPYGFTGCLRWRRSRSGHLCWRGWRGFTLFWAAGHKTLDRAIAVNRMNQVRGRTRLFAVRLYSKLPARGLTITPRGAFSSPRRNIRPSRVNVREAGPRLCRRLPPWRMPYGTPCLTARPVAGSDSRRSLTACVAALPYRTTGSEFERHPRLKPREISNVKHANRPVVGDARRGSSPSFFQDAQAVGVLVNTIWMNTPKMARRTFRCAFPDW